MPDLGRWNGMDQLSEKYLSTSSYAYVANNSISMIDPDGRWMDEAGHIDTSGQGKIYFGGRQLMTQFMGQTINQGAGGGLSQGLMDTAARLGGTWSNTGFGFENEDHIGLRYDGSYTSLNTTLDKYVDIPEVIMTGRVNNKGYNSLLMYSKITGAQNQWNLGQNRANYYNKVAETGADKVERNFYLMFGGALAAPFIGSFIATVGGETAGGYLQGSLIRGVTDIALQKTIKGSVDWKQTGINAFIGGGQGLGAVKIGWANFAGNMANNFGTSYYDGGKNGFIKDFGINSMKVLTGAFGMGVANYNSLTSGYLNGYFGTTILPGVYFNTTDVVIENK